MLPNIEAVVFDLDGTLLDRRRSFDRFVRHQWERFAPSLGAVNQEDYVQSVKERDRDGHGPRKDLFTGLSARFELPPALSQLLLEDYRVGFPSACLLFPDATQTLSALRAAGMKLGLITNGSVRMQSRKLECLALRPLFDTILISEAEGIHKPDRRIFGRALEHLNTAPGRAVFVGDDPDVDIAGARAAGMHAIWRRDPQVLGTVATDIVIDELGDVLSLLRTARAR